MTPLKKEYSLKIDGLEQSFKGVVKLDDAVNALDKSITTLNKKVEVQAKEAKAAAKVLTEEEKAAAKLAATQKRIADATSEANKAQILANQQLREATREVTRQVAASQLAEDSIAAMGMQLTDLRLEYDRLTAAQRNDVEVGGVLLEQIQSLDAEYKALKESTGRFQDSVGNYERALSGLDSLEQSLDKVAQTSQGLQSALAQNSALMGIFGNVSESTAAIQSQLAAVLAIVNLAQVAYNAFTEEGIIVTTASAAIDAVKTVQLRAKAAAEALATKGTIAATVAQAAFNLVAAANPYVLLALALVTVVGALALFVASTADAAGAQRKLNEEQAIWLEYLDTEKARLEEVSKDRVSALERQLRLLNAQGAATAEVRKVEDEIAKARVVNNSRLLGFYAEEVGALEINRLKLEDYYAILRNVQQAQARGDNRISIDVDLNGQARKLKVEDAIDIVQGRIDNLNKAVEIAVSLKAEQADLRAEIETQKAERIKADREEAKRRAEEAKQKAEEAENNAREIAAAELEALRAAEDVRLKLIGSSYEQQRQTIRVSYAREIEDLKIRLDEEKNLSSTARKAINDQIKDLAKLRNLELANLDKERAENERETLQQAEEQKTALIVGQEDRRRAEINAGYDRQIDDAKRRLKEELDLTAAQRQSLNDLVIGYEQQRGNELEALTIEGLNRRASLELQILDSTLQQVQDKIAQATTTRQGGLLDGLIDVDATKAALSATNAALSDYTTGLVKYQQDLQQAHDATLATLQTGSIEYEEELQRYVAANEMVTKKIRDAQKLQVENTKASTQTQATYYQQLVSKVAEYASIAAQAVTGVFDTWNQGLQVALESLNDQLDTINEAYDKAGEQREAYAQNVEDIEERLRTATGGTALALREQLLQAMSDREEAARAEDKLRREKEKKEAEVAKKEKAMRRNDLIGGIATAIANTAQGVTKALTLVFPLNLVIAGLVGALGAVQTGIMARQLTKLAKGGPIKGPSHSEGGVPVPEFGVEMEGGEFVTNKESYAANRGLVEFINDNPRALSVSDIAGALPGEAGPPVIIQEPGTNRDAALIEAIQGIEMRPVVSVVDIIDVTNQVTTVEELAGF
jgi:hypothetical protein